MLGYPVDTPDPADEATTDGGQPRRRGVAALACACTGLVAAREVPAIDVWWWLGASATAIALAALARGRACAWFLALAMAALGGAWMHSRVHREDTHALTRLVAGPILEATPSAEAASLRDGVLVLEGVIEAAPEPRTARSVLDLWRPVARSTRVSAAFPLRVLAAGEGSAWGDATHARAARSLVPSSGRVWVYVAPASAAEGWHAGQTVRLVGLYRPPGINSMPGQRDQRLASRHDAFVGTIAVQGESALKRGSDLTAPGAVRAWLSRALAGVRAGARSALGEVLPEAPSERARPALEPSATSQARALLAALLIGEYDPDVRPLADAWARLGLLHALSISGFHLTIMAGAMMMLVRLTGDRGRLEAWAVAGLLLVYLVIVPAQAPIVRSVLMSIALLLAHARGRRYDPVNLLAWFAVLLLAWRPLDAFDPGFQLSFGLTAALFALAPHWARRVRQALAPAPGVRGRRARPASPARALATNLALGVLTALSTSLMAWAIASPIVALHFGLLSPWAALVSVPVVIVLVPTLWLGFAALVLGATVAPWLPPVGTACAWMLEHLGLLLVHATHWMDALPGAALPLPAIPTLLAAGLVVGAAWAMGARSWHRPGPWVVLSACALGASLVLTRGWRGPERALAFELPIQDGACVLVRSGGVSVLIDAGSERAGVSERLGRDVPAAVRALGGWTTPILLLTEIDPRHASGALGVVRPLGVRSVIVSDGAVAAWRTNPASPAAALLNRLHAQGCSIIGAADADVLDLQGLSLTLRRRGDLGLAVDGLPPSTPTTAP